MRRLIDVTFRPIDKWPGERTAKRRRSQFRAGWDSTLELLRTELVNLRATGVVIMLAITEDDIRLDGWPRANASPAHPGVILAFDSPHGPLKYPCDTYTDYRDNLRAIALALQALRAVDRYGVTKRGEQYTGWRALPGGGGTEPTMTTQAAGAVIESMADRGGLMTLAADIARDRRAYIEALRPAVRGSHPDSGGSTEAFQLFQQAKRVLDAHHRGR